MVSGHKKKLNFTVKDNGGWKSPRWQEVEVDNATCPNCGEQMTVIIHEFIYAHCAGPKGCGKYFLGG